MIQWRQPDNSTKTLVLNIETSPKQSRTKKLTYTEPFSCYTFEIAPLIAILCVDFVRVNWPCDVIFLHNNAIEVNEGLGDHIEPFVGEPLSFFLKTVSQEARPG